MAKFVSVKRLENALAAQELLVGLANVEDRLGLVVLTVQHLRFFQLFLRGTNNHFEGFDFLKLLVADETLDSIGLFLILFRLQHITLGANFMLARQF